MAVTVKDLMEKLASGNVTIDQVESEFKRRKWPAAKQLTLDILNEDPEEPDDNSFFWVTASDLDDADYTRLANAAANDK